MEKVVPRLFREYPDAESLSKAEMHEVVPLIASLGFGNRRAGNLIEMSKEYLKSNWDHARQLPGIGQYAAAAWEIFVLGSLPEECPKDHALTMYWHWRKKHGI